MRVLIATVTAGGGHLAAAAALHEAWHTLRPSDQIQKLDLSEFFSPIHRKLHGDGYSKLIEHAPEIWGMVFSRTDDTSAAGKLSKLSRIFTATSRNRFRRAVESFQPDVALCTHYLPLETLGDYKAKPSAKSSSPSQLFVVSVVTDFEAHAVWMAPSVDLYCVAFQETCARLIARGADPASIVATGIPISFRFAKVPDAAPVRKQMGLRDDLPVLLVLSGGFGMGPVAEILKAIDKVGTAFQTVVVTGRNQELRRELAVSDFRHPTHVKGFASNVHELMAAADLIITKPGGLTSSEALALGKPLFIVNPIPGQEAANSDFLLERGAAVKVNRVEDLQFRVTQLLGSPKLRQMAKAAAKLGRPSATKSICTEVLTRMQSASAKL